VNSKRKTGNWKVEGFTLLELVVIVAVMAILAAAVAPTFLNQIGDARIQATQEEAQTLYEAIVGHPTESGTQFGFVGDMGEFPASFTALVQPGSLPAYTTATVRNVGMGPPTIT
jgi:type II secretory pathway pseudopilin PulG